MPNKLHYKLCKLIYRYTKYSNVDLWWGYYRNQQTPCIAHRKMTTGFKSVFPAYTFPPIRLKP